MCFPSDPRHVLCCVSIGFPIACVIKNTLKIAFDFALTLVVHFHGEFHALPLKKYMFHVKLRLISFFHLFTVHSLRDSHLTLSFGEHVLVIRISLSWFLPPTLPAAFWETGFAFYARSVYDIQLSLFCYLTWFIHEFTTSNSRTPSESGIFPSFPASQLLLCSPVNHSIGLPVSAFIFHFHPLFIVCTYHITSFPSYAFLFFSAPFILFSCNNFFSACVVIATISETQSSYLDLCWFLLCCFVLFCFIKG